MSQPGEVASRPAPAAGGSASMSPLTKAQSDPSAPKSPYRHHHRERSKGHTVRETRNAHSEYSTSEDDGASQLRINQYLIREEIGRGSFGAVHRATDQYGREYAVKEFSKTRLRRRAKSDMLRRSRQRSRGAGSVGELKSPMGGLNLQSPLPDEDNSFDLIKEEIAVMKKLNHPNLVALYEVLDDPEEDSLYMVVEMCKKGVVMKVEVDQNADPYPAEACRCWFRDLLLGIEYLHAQGVIHRDIKPDNCLLTDDHTLKIVDFGVSEMFEKHDEMKVAKTAGSPAFMAPELCTVKAGDVFGKPADIWSMGVTLFCLMRGRVPFEKSAVLELYHSIANDAFDLGDDCAPDFADLMHRLLEKDPAKRITMAELREHPWVTLGGEDPLLPAEENCAAIVEPPTEQEKNHAITSNMGRAVAVMKAVHRFKSLVERDRPSPLTEGVFGRASRFVQPPLQMSQKAEEASPFAKLSGQDTTPARRAATGPAGLSRWVERARLAGPAAAEESPQASPQPPRSKSTHDFDGKGQARDPLEDHVFVDIGTGEERDNREFSVSESPPPASYNMFENAYKSEVARIRQEKGLETHVYLTRRVEGAEVYDAASLVERIAEANPHVRIPKMPKLMAGLDWAVRTAQDRAAKFTQEMGGPQSQGSGAQKAEPGQP